MASQIAEELITAMTLDDRPFQAGARRVIATVQNLMAHLNALKAAAAGAMGAGAGGAGGGFNFGAGNQFNFQSGGGGGGQGGGGGGFGMGRMVGLYAMIRVVRDVEHAVIDADKALIDFGKDAVGEFASFDTLTRSFEGIYHSGAKATQMMTFLRDAAMTSAFHFKDLSEAARTLAVAGMDVNRFLPMVQGITLAAKGVDPETLQRVADLFRRIESGAMGLAMGQRGFPSLGIGHTEMEKYGAKFDGPNKSHFEGTSNQAFDILEKVYKARIEAIALSVTASSEVVLSNLGDAWQQMTIEAGSGLMQNLYKPIKDVTGALNELRQSGVIKDLFDTLAQITGVDQLGGKGGVEDILLDIGQGIVTFVALQRNVVMLLDSLYKRLTFGADPGGGLLQPAIDEGRSWREGAEAKLDAERRDRRVHPEKYKAPLAPSGNEIPGLEEASDIKKIEQHTRAIRKGIEHAGTFGGGDVGRMGVTAVELSGLVKGTGHASHMAGIINLDVLSTFMNVAIQRALAQAARNRLLT